jgi:hypothetical protein
LGRRDLNRRQPRGLTRLNCGIEGGVRCIELR